MHSNLVTVDTIRARLALNTTDTADDELIRTLCGEATKHVVQYCRRHFVPVRQTRRFDARGSHIGARTLRLDDDLLAIVTLTNGDSAVVANTDYVLRPSNVSPKNAVELLPSKGLTWTYGDDWQEALSIDGLWGYHEEWDGAWVATGETVPSGGLSDSATTLVVTDSARLDAWGNKAFGIGQLLRIDSEYVVVRSVTVTTGPPVTHTLTLFRAANGTTAAAHLQDAVIERFVPMADVEGATAALVVWLYKSRDTIGEKMQFLDGTQLITNEAPAHIKLTLGHYRRLTGAGI